MICHISKCVASKEKIYIYLVSERSGQDIYRGIKMYVNEVRASIHTFCYLKHGHQYMCYL